MFMPIISPRERMERKSRWMLKPVITEKRTSVNSKRAKTTFKQIRTELFTPGSTALNIMSETKPLGLPSLGGPPTAPGAGGSAAFGEDVAIALQIKPKCQSLKVKGRTMRTQLSKSCAKKKEKAVCVLFGGMDLT